MSFVIKDGRLLTDNGSVIMADLFIENGIIEVIAENIEIDAEKVIDASGLLVSPGFIDLHVHLREPGGEEKETIATGTMAAARGGFTTIAAMPNTKPVIDSVEHLEWLRNRIKETAAVRVFPYAAITEEESGQQLTDFQELSKAGAIAFTDDGHGVQSADVMLKAMKKAAKLNKIIAAHCEDNTLINNGCVHEGKFAQSHSLKGIPSACESVHVARDALLAEAAGCHYHVCHISTKESVRVVREAKKAGIKITSEVTPHHLILCDDDIPGNDANYKMNPPLRSKADREALLEGLLDGTIDVIATDHAPHTPEEKSKGMVSAPFGIIGLETAFSLLYTQFVETGTITLKKLIDLMSVKPAEIFGLPFGKLKSGSAADLILIDLQHEKTIDPDSFLSKGRNTPFAGWKCKGWPVMTMVNGKIVWMEQHMQGRVGFYA
ncbi:MAG TPA: dihydroorotase [Clostridiales bacterium]|nr:dihydroorotase [Clostridiales bacterium]